MSAHIENHRALQAFVHKVDELPLLPQVLVRVMQLDPGADDYFDELTLLAREDPALAVRVIARANSAASCPVKPMLSLKGALVRVGADAVRSLVTSLGVQRVFMPTDPSQVRLWQHSITAAVAAEAVATFTPALGVPPDHAYLAGLLHDIGRFVMFEHAQAELLAVDHHEWDTPEHLIDADYEVFQFTHSELGFQACLHWGLPLAIANCVHTHHDSPLPSVGSGSPEALSYCVQVADRMALAVLDDRVDDVDEEALTATIESRCLAPVFDRAIADAGQLAAQMRNIDARRNSLLAGLGFGLRPEHGAKH